MAYTAHPTVVTGQTWTAANQNTYVRDNFAALWPYTTQGDISHATSGSALARLAAGTAGQVLAMNSGATAPEWVAPAGLHTIGIADFQPGGQVFSSTSWADITNATLDLTTTRECTIVMVAVVTGYNAVDGNAFLVRGVIGGTADTSGTTTQAFNGGSTDHPRNEALPYIRYLRGVSAGTITCKLQCVQQGSNNIVERGRMIALAFVEPE